MSKLPYEWIGNRRGKQKIGDRNRKFHSSTWPLLILCRSLRVKYLLEKDKAKIFFCNSLNCFHAFYSKERFCNAKNSQRIELLKSAIDGDKLRRLPFLDGHASLRERRAYLFTFLFTFAQENRGIKFIINLCTSCNHYFSYTRLLLQ